MTKMKAMVCEIDTLLLSCRVIGRTVETALLSYFAECATARGRRRLSGWFLPTKKNVPAKDFYAQHGFQLEQQTSDGSRWSLDLRTQSIASPEWIKLNVLTGVNQLTSTAFEQVRGIASDLFAVPAQEITPESSPETIKSWDSTQHLSLVLALEEQFQIQLSPEEIEQMTSIGEIARLLESKLQSSPK